MAYTDLINATDADPLIPVEVSREIITTLEDDFWLLNMARRLAPFLPVKSGCLFSAHWPPLTL